MSETPVTVIGAGYAGVMAANRMAARGQAVRLISPGTDFVERIRLHRFASGDRATAAVPLGSVLHDAVVHVDDRVTRIDLAASTLHLASGDTLPHDLIVLAVGSGASLPRDGVHRVDSEAAAARLRQVLADDADAPVTVVGAGLTGTELAAVLARTPRRVTLVTRPEPHERRAHRAHLRHLAGHGVRVVTDDGRDWWSAPGVVVDCTGFSTPGLARESGLPTDESGRLLVDETLTVPGHPSIIGAGDGAVVPTMGHLRPSCATAIPMGAHAADVVAAAREGRPRPVFSSGYLLQCVDLGGRDGHAQFVHADDSERPVALGGWAGGWVKETICGLTLTWLRQERDRAGRYSWPAGPKLDGAAAVPVEA